jgi:hypothetical protein
VYGTCDESCVGGTNERTSRQRGLFEMVGLGFAETRHVFSGGELACRSVSTVYLQSDVTITDHCEGDGEEHRTHFSYVQYSKMFHYAQQEED